MEYKRFQIEPIGSIGDEACREVGSFLEETFGLPFSLGPLRSPPVTAYNPLRGQYMAFPILEFLDESPAPKAFRRIGLTDLDLCTPVLTYVFGLARMSGGDCLVSTFRLKPEFHGLPPDPEISRERLFKEVLHELGHTFGLKHCGESSCVMHFAHSVAQIDARRAGYCDACRESVEISVAEEKGEENS